MISSSFAVENRIWDPVEKLPRPELAALQTARLRETVERVRQVPFYREAFRRNSITPDQIRSLDDLKRLPFTTKADLREHYPLGFLAVAREKVLRYHGSSGTTGQPTMVAYTRRDLETWAGLCARFLTAGGLTAAHTVQIAFGYGLFTGGFGLHYGVEKVGSAVIPAAAGNTERQVMLLLDMQAEVLVCTPSYALNISEYLLKKNIPRDRLRLKYGHFGGEPWTEDMRSRIEQELGILCFNNYGLSEVLGPGVSGECALRDGMHIVEDCFLVECVHPETLDPVAPGESGELVFTSLCREAMPLLRYRTRDIATLLPDPCPCGRTSVRMSRVTGRSDDMLIIKGVNVFPSLVEEALLQVEGTAPHYLIQIERPGRMDAVTVQVELTEATFATSMKELQQLKARIAHRILSLTGVHMQIELVSPGSLERFTGKARRVMDYRPGTRPPTPDPRPESP